MKKRLSILFAIFSLIAFPVLSDDDPGNDKGGTSGNNNGNSGPGGNSGMTPPSSPTIPIEPKVPPTFFPNSNYGQYVDCFYDGENLIFNFAISEGICNMTLTETEKGSVRWFVFDSSTEAIVYVGDIWNASIYINTEFGNSYEGWYGE